MFGRQKAEPEPLSIVLSNNPDCLHEAPQQYHLVLSGGRLGGLLGLVSLGWTYTAALLAERVRKDVVPDHGLWAKGYQRQYISRGLGSGALFPPWPPLRCGVPAEVPVLSIEVPSV
eukprot:Hpha_TRINITY_DN8623_c0_g2::TRINITY_DN8623_c0_g2_i1::g.168820::m.168820